MKNSSKGIILKYSPVAFMLELICFVLIIVMLYLTIRLYPEVPESVPRYYSVYGSIIGWGNKPIALLWPMAAVYVYLILTAGSLLVRRIPEESGHNYKVSTALIMILCAKIVFLVFAIVSAYSTLMIQDMPALSILILPVGILATVIVGIMMVRNKNSYSLAIKEAKV